MKKARLLHNKIYYVKQIYVIEEEYNIYKYVSYVFDKNEIIY